MIVLNDGDENHIIEDVLKYLQRINSSVYRLQSVKIIQNGFTL